MTMYKPPHSGEFIESIYRALYGISCRKLAKHHDLDMAASALNRVPKDQSAVSPEIALRLPKVLGHSPESWLSMQNSDELRQVRKTLNLSKV
ncbi:MAG: HigA family addiction module antitoxin [Candidatus Reddybacter sp.]